MNTNTRRLEPAFNFSDNEPSTLLHQGHVKFHIGEGVYTGDGEVRLDLDQQVGIHFYGYLKDPFSSDFKELFSRKENIEKTRSFLFNDLQIKGSALNQIIKGTKHIVKWPPGAEHMIKWHPESKHIIGIGDESTQMTHVVFHLFNFPDFVDMRGGDTHQTYMESRVSAHHLEFHTTNYICLSNENWEITIKSLIFTHKIIDRLKKEGGYGLTHVGEIRKKDQTPFTGKEVQECLMALEFFFSFAKGCRCEPVCPVGFDENENRVWELWSSPTHSWQEPESWFYQYRSFQLSALFPGFMKRWANDDWRGALHEAIYWYLNANHPSLGKSAGIILTQAAIERLSYEYLVKQEKFLSRNKFKKTAASNIFHQLFSSLKIPHNISSATPELVKTKSTDAPCVFIKMRNSLVHPERKNRGQSEAAHSEAWNLGLWYLERSILAICDYSGGYRNRLTRRFVDIDEDTSQELTS